MIQIYPISGKTTGDRENCISIIIIEDLNSDHKNVFKFEM